MVTTQGEIMELAIISPVQYLEQFSTLGDFDFALCHVLVEERQLNEKMATPHTPYRDYFKKQSESGRVVLLDNGAHEESCVDIFTLCANAGDIKATHVIAPDVVGNTDDTLKNTEEFLYFVETNVEDKFQIIGVAQGSTLADWLRCYTWMSKNPYIDVVAIPYDINFLLPVVHGAMMSVQSMFSDKQLMKPLTKSVAQCYTRIQVMEMLAHLDQLEKPIHLLGWSLPYEIYYYKKHKIDTLVKLSNDSQGYCVYPLEVSNLWLDDLEEFLHNKISTPSDFHRTIDKKYHTKIYDFITGVREYLGST